MSEKNSMKASLHLKPISNSLLNASLSFRIISTASFVHVELRPQKAPSQYNIDDRRTCQRAIILSQHQVGPVAMTRIRRKNKVLITNIFSSYIQPHLLVHKAAVIQQVSEGYQRTWHKKEDVIRWKNFKIFFASTWNLSLMRPLKRLNFQTNLSHVRFFGPIGRLRTQFANFQPGQATKRGHKIFTHPSTGTFFPFQRASPDRFVSWCFV